MNGVEDVISSATPISSSGPDLTFDLTRFQPRTFAVTIAGSPTVGMGQYRVTPSQSAALDVSISVRLAARSANVHFKLPAGEQIVNLGIVDASGKLIRSLVKNGNCGAARNFVVDARNDHSANLGKGLYFVFLTTNRSRLSTRLMVVE
jgi:flagellar hook assembly protein FlgD